MPGYGHRYWDERTADNRRRAYPKFRGRHTADMVIIGGGLTGATADWQPVRTRFIVPPGVAQIQPRLIGNGPLIVWLDDFSLQKTGNVNAMRGTNLPSVLVIKNPSGFRSRVARVRKSSGLGRCSMFSRLQIMSKGA